MRLTERAHQFVRDVLKIGEIAIDATAGNGHDTAFLADVVGPPGHVYAFDVQPQAIDECRQRLENASIHHVTILQADHADLLTELPPSVVGRVGAIMFNLGYLPGGDKRTITRTDSTLAAIRGSLMLLRRGGILTIVAYTGHAGGEEETEAVRQACGQLDQTEYASTEIAIANTARGNAPVLFIVRKTDGKS